MVQFCPNLRWQLKQRIKWTLSRIMLKPKYVQSKSKVPVTLYLIIASLVECRKSISRNLWCAHRYTFGQPVPGEAKIKVCRSLSRYFPRPLLVDDENTPELLPLCHEESMQVGIQIHFYFALPNFYLYWYISFFKIL